MLLTEGCFSSPFKSRTTTVSGTIIDNDTKLPLSGIEIIIYGVKGGKEYNFTNLKTDVNGYYSATVDAPKGYQSVGVANIYFRDFIFLNKYSGYLLYINGQQTQDCCLVEIGSETKYDFNMLPK